MTTLEDRTYESGSEVDPEDEQDSDMPTLLATDEADLENQPDDECLVTLRSLNTHIEEDET